MLTEKLKMLITELKAEMQEYVNTHNSLSKNATEPREYFQGLYRSHEGIIVRLQCLLIEEEERARC